MFQKISPVSFQLAENTFKNCSGDLEMYRSEAIMCLDVPVENYAEVVVLFFQDATQRDNAVCFYSCKTNPKYLYLNIYETACLFLFLLALTLLLFRVASS